VNKSYYDEEAPIRRIFGSPSPVKSNHCQTFDIMSTPQQGPSADADSASQENGDADRSPSASNLFRLIRGRQFFVLERGRRCDQAGNSLPIKMSSRSQWQVQLLAQPIYQRYQKSQERKGLDLSVGRTPLKWCPQNEKKITMILSSITNLASRSFSIP